MGKITETEFKNWSKDFAKKLKNFILTFWEETPKQERDKLIDISVNIRVAVENKNTFAVATFLEFFSNLFDWRRKR